MSRRQRVSGSGREGDDPGPLCMRAPAYRPLRYDDNPPLETISIETLLHWAFARQQVHKARPTGLAELGPLTRPSGFPSSASSERIGAAVGSSKGLGSTAHPDAYAVMAAIKRMGRDDRDLVMVQALANEAPDWTPQPEIWFERGGPIRGRLNRRTNRQPIIAYAVYARGDTPGQVEQRRLVYSRWAQAVADLHAALAAPGVLVKYKLLNQVPHLTPWL